MSDDRTRIFGPLICTADPTAHEALFRDVFGMESTLSARLGPAEATALFAPGDGLAGAEMKVLRTPGTDTGVILLKVEPTSSETIRTWESRTLADALKVVDFYAPDYEGAIARARSCGYDVIEHEASYELPEGTFREAHLWGPDNVVTAFLGGPVTFFADFALLTDGLVSEVQSISAPVSDAQVSLDFYRRVFGWDIVHEYAIDDPSFAEMVGVDELRLKAHNVGANTREPYVGMIDYGLTGAPQASLRGRSRAPRRGLLGVVVITERFDAVVAAAGSDAGPVVGHDLLGLSHGALVTTPHSVPHLVLGTSARGEHR